MAHYLTKAYERSSNYLQGVRADPANLMGIVRALGVLCEGLSTLRDDDDFWAELTEQLGDRAPDLDTRQQELSLDTFFETELAALTEEMEGDEAAARRLLDDLGATVAGARFDQYTIPDVREVTRQFCELVCAERGTLEQAVQVNQAEGTKVQGDKVQGNNVRWRSRFRALRIAIGATVFVAGGAVVVVDLHTVVLVAPAAGVESMRAGLAAMVGSFVALRADLG